MNNDRIKINGAKVKGQTIIRCMYRMRINNATRQQVVIFLFPMNICFSVCGSSVKPQDCET